ncbi:hypothetical protein [Pedobacter psychrodurus]|uniref:hypothetical protein n=1 Tax=Pedobacter psychrodurus TaxID=2530456 RepID=UPI00292D330E|nr:hypothetical protein [Pedobacter psychrodurus]
MNNFEETGGVRIGSFRATWPFATLKVSEFKFELNASIKGNFIFKRSDIISIIPHTSTLGSSIQIIHRVEKYNKKILFTFLGNAEDRMVEIQQTGFLNRTATTPGDIDLAIDQLQQQSDFPIKNPVAIGIVVIWNLLFLCNFFNVFYTRKETELFGICIGLALAFVFLICILLLTSDAVRQLVLKSPGGIGSIKPFLFFIAFITFVLFCAGFVPQYLANH